MARLLTNDWLQEREERWQAGHDATFNGGHPSLAYFPTTHACMLLHFGHTFCAALITLPVSVALRAMPLFTSHSLEHACHVCGACLSSMWRASPTHLMPSPTYALRACLFHRCVLLLHLTQPLLLHQPVSLHSVVHHFFMSKIVMNEKVTYKDVAANCHIMRQRL